ncbi:MAG: SLC13 family permease, partial [Acidimicrobiales bacterium]
VLAAGLAALVLAAALSPPGTAAAAGQDWPPFVLVAGLLLVGLAARTDGLFEAAGSLMAGAARGGRSLFVAAAVLVAVVTAVLNLDTAVAFLTPVLVVAARRRRTGEAPFLYLAVFGANGASLLLPGSNLTNLIVLGHVHQSGGAFAAAMALPWLAASAAVAVVVGLAWRRSLAAAGARREGVVAPVPGAGSAGVVVAVVAMVALPGDRAALVVVAAGLAAAGWGMARRRVALADVRAAVDLRVLGGLFGLALAMGALGRAWSWPAHLLAHASLVGTAVVGAVASVVVNNLPAASLLAARAPAQPHALLVGLDLGPNLAVTGALSAVLWLQVARSAGAHPSAARYSALGVVVVPVSMAAALAVLAAAH